MTSAGLASARAATSAIRVSEKPRSAIDVDGGRSICSRRRSGPDGTSGASRLADLVERLAIRPLPPARLPAGTPCPEADRLRRLNGQSNISADAGVRGTQAMAPAPDRDGSSRRRAAVRAMLEARSVARGGRQRAAGQLRAPDGHRGAPQHRGRWRAPGQPAVRRDRRPALRAQPGRPRRAGGPGPARRAGQRARAAAARPPRGRPLGRDLRQRRR